MRKAFLHQSSELRPFLHPRDPLAPGYTSLGWLPLSYTHVSLHTAINFKFYITSDKFIMQNTLKFIYLKSSLDKSAPAILTP